MTGRREVLSAICGGAILGALGAGLVPSPCQTDRAAETEIGELFAEFHRLHHRDWKLETAEESEANHLRYCDLQERIVAAEPKTMRDLAMQSCADSSYFGSDPSSAFEERLLALALEGRAS